MARLLQRAQRGDKVASAKPFISYNLSTSKAVIPLICRYVGYFLKHFKQPLYHWTETSWGSFSQAAILLPWVTASWLCLNFSHISFILWLIMVILCCVYCRQIFRLQLWAFISSCAVSATLTPRWPTSILTAAGYRLYRNNCNPISQSEKRIQLRRQIMWCSVLALLCSVLWNFVTFWFSLQTAVCRSPDPLLLLD